MTTKARKEQAVTLGEWANIAIAKHTGKILKHEAGVLKDKEPEELHQMRVGMRRLRSALIGFAPALDLPEIVNQKNIGKLGRSLGKLRDLDVLLDALTNQYRSLLPTAEQKSLDKVLKSLNKKREHISKQVQETLSDGLYLDLKQGLQNWLEQPTYQEIADLSIYPVLPDLLLPQVSKLLLHPGWLVGVKLKKGKIQFPKQRSSKSVEKLLAEQDTILHDLRKEAKRSRYNLELFSQFYDNTYQDQIKKIEQIQEILGQIQDCFVLTEVLEKELKSEIANQMPELATLLTKTSHQKWQEWLTIQKHFLDERSQQELRLTIQQPLAVQTHTKKIV
jgi:CHAD domain-containing protein